MITLNIPEDEFHETMIALRDRHATLEAEKSNDPVVREITRRQLARVQCAIKVLADGARVHAIRAAEARGEPPEYYAIAGLVP